MRQWAGLICFKSSSVCKPKSVNDNTLGARLSAFGVERCLCRWFGVQPSLFKKCWSPSSFVKPNIDGLATYLMGGFRLLRNCMCCTVPCSLWSVLLLLGELVMTVLLVSVVGSAASGNELVIVRELRSPISSFCSFVHFDINAISDGIHEN